jgi:hypothetical protein
MSAFSENIRFCHNDYNGPGVAVLSSLGSKGAVAAAEGRYRPKSSVLAITNLLSIFSRSIRCSPTRRYH